MDSTPVYLESLGLTMLVPVDTITESTGGAGQAQVQIRPGDSRWVITLRNIRSGSREATTSEMLELVVQNAKNAISGDTRVPPAEMERDTKLQVNNRPAERVYLKLEGKPGSPTFIQGFTVFKLGPGNFAVFEVVCGQAEFATVRGMYETVVAAAVFDDLSESNQKRQALVAAGTALVRGLTDEDWATVISQSPERWERLFRPAPGGAQSDEKEIGYRRTRAMKGRKSDLPRYNASAGENQEGYIFRLDARFLRDAPKPGEKPEVVDVEAYFYMSLDRSEELWQVRTALKKGEKPAIYTETGARVGDVLSVQIGLDDGTRRTVKPFLQGDAYISRVESFMMPRLLVHKKILTEVAFYAFQSDREKVQLRRDVLAQPADRPGVFILTTRFAEDGLSQTAHFKANGDPIRTELADGTRWEPTDLRELRRLWSSKGLPLD
ncbi:MAG: hypothetical protein HRU70_00500 [Phycisphaeraceae bacterium]|nr:MAG: hypothetical protein HRU70_00500 [Phycisphaeraceae bacterium]